MSVTYLVNMPKAEASHLAGVGPRELASPKDRALAAVREWLVSIAGRRAATVPVAKVAADLTAILDTVPVAAGPVRGPFASHSSHRPRMPGRVEYLGGGIVRLDEDAISSLAGLASGEDFRVRFSDAGPVLTVGADTYLAREEEPAAKPRPPAPT